MTYTRLITDELVIIESYFKMNQSVAKTTHCLNCSRQTAHKVYLFFKQGKSASGYYQQYRENKLNCGKRLLVLPEGRSEYIQRRVAQGWTPDMVIGRAAFPISRSACTVHRMSEKGLPNPSDLPMKGKRKPNGHQERRGKQTFRRFIHERERDYSQFSNEFDHPEGDTIVGLKYRSAATTLVERLSKVIITLKPCDRQAIDIEKKLNQWFESVSKNLFKSITSNCEEKLSNWKQISNVSDIAIYFADPETSPQRSLNENSNGLLRRDDLSKSMNLDSVDEFFIQSVASKRSNIPRKSLDYRTSLEVLLSYVSIDDLSNLI